MSFEAKVSIHPFDSLGEGARITVANFQGFPRYLEKAPLAAAGNSLTTIEIIGFWAHVKRKFYEPKTKAANDLLIPAP